MKSQNMREAEADVERNNKLYKESEKDQGSEDMSILFEDDSEDSLIRMLKGSNPMPKSTFTSSCQAMLGDDWLDVGEQILRQQAPELLGKFLAYAD